MLDSIARYILATECNTTIHRCVHVMEHALEETSAFVKQAMLETSVKPSSLFAMERMKLILKYVVLEECAKTTSANV